MKPSYQESLDRKKIPNFFFQFQVKIEKKKKVQMENLNYSYVGIRECG